MAVARLALKNLQQKFSTSALSAHLGNRAATLSKQRWDSEIMRRFSTAASEKVSDDREVAVSEGDGKKSKLFRRNQRRRNLWRNPGFPLSLNEFFPSGLENALLQASENLNRLLENLTPSRLMGRMREDDDSYKLRYEVPGLSKEDVKITIEDGFLTIKGEHQEEDVSDDDRWSSASCGYYNTSLQLPDDAKVDEIKAEMKDGLLFITIPRTGQRKDVKEVMIQ
ncbi:PREDICTED: 26.5 kDa heat shock protein, mitochondrial [Nelumbo nucifera]|uniref:SHSP domain-containing protein n=2 Tax=Nelumbo nucifera TaxID=4432 RepID=A0A822ZIG3_NELNU|nr:PREDICTED: 26.5 kDa heat shock protein, mitochondrial [Nelumbo nucifera]DAD44922.1 TPA_asm: hypothetical protein HUJ06_003152 [Nelumbo nucifera]